MSTASDHASAAISVLKNEGVAVFARKVFNRYFDREKQSTTPQSINRGNVQVLFVNGCDAPHPTRYRVIHQMEQLESLGVTTDLVHYTDVTLDDGERADIIFVYRCPLWGDVVNVTVEAQRVGKPVYFDVDDLVIDTLYTEDLPFLRDVSDDDRNWFQSGVRRTGQMARVCDHGITTTMVLCAELQKFIPDVFINRNVASKEMVYYSQVALQEKSHSEDEVIIGYFSGSITHNADFEMIVPPLAKVMAVHPEVVLAVVGELSLPEQLKPFADRIRSNDFVDYRQLPTLIATADINLAPIEPTLFNAAKSENKWMEAALVRVPTVASNFGAFAEVVSDKENGLLCETLDDWEANLSALIEDSRYRTRIADNAYRFCMRYRTTENSGFPLARHLLNLPPTVDNLLPKSDYSRNRLVSDWFDRFGVTIPQVCVEVEPWKRYSTEERLDAVRSAAESGKKVCLAIYDRNAGDTATFRYFGYNPFAAMNNQKSLCTVFFYLDEVNLLSDILEMINSVVFIRMRISPEFLLWVSLLKEKAIHTAYLIDDDAVGYEAAEHVFSLMASDLESSFERDFWFGCCRRFELAEICCDVSIVTLPGFATRVSVRTNQPCAVVRNSLNSEQLEVSATAVQLFENNNKKRSFIIGYFSGTASHDDDFTMCAQPLADFLSENPNSELLIVGSLTLPDCLYPYWVDHRIEVLPLVDYATLQFLQASVDVILAPLVIDDFSNCKSALKVFEAAAVETPALASPSEGYIEAIENGVTGFICRSSQDWSDALLEAYKHPDKLKKMGKLARERSLDHYSPEALSSQWRDAMSVLENTPIKSIPDFVKEALSSVDCSNWDDSFVVNPLFSKKFKG